MTLPSLPKRWQEGQGTDDEMSLLDAAYLLACLPHRRFRAIVSFHFRLLNWRFGADPAEMQLGFSMQFFPGERQGEATVEWTYKGETSRRASFLLSASTYFTRVLQTHRRDDELSLARWRGLHWPLLAQCRSHVDAPSRNGIVDPRLCERCERRGSAVWRPRYLPTTSC